MELKTKTVRIPEELIKKIKIYCINNDITEQDFFKMVIEKFLDNN